MNDQSNAIKVIDEADDAKKLPYQLKAREAQFNAALPAHIPVERFMRVVLTAVQNNPSLALADRKSLWNACMRAAQDGLLPDGRDGALVIYKTKEGDAWIEKVQWMPMIAGLRKKVRNSGEIKDWNAQVVHAKDNFEFELGDQPFIKHKPYMGEGDPGPVIAAYSIAYFASGEVSREVMTRGQIDRVRAASRSRDKGPWVEWYDEMARKTVARRHAKVLPMSTDLDDLIRRDDQLYDLEGASDKQPHQAPRGPRLPLEQRLEILSNGGKPPHDPETGEVKPETGDSAVPEAAPAARQVGEDSDRDAATLADLRNEGDRRADNGGEDALVAFEAGLSNYEQALLAPYLPAMRARAKKAKR